MGTRRNRYARGKWFGKPVRNIRAMPLRTAVVCFLRALLGSRRSTLDSIATAINLESAVAEAVRSGWPSTRMSRLLSAASSFPHPKARRTIIRALAIRMRETTWSDQAVYVSERAFSHAPRQQSKLKQLVSKVPDGDESAQRSAEREIAQMIGTTAKSRRFAANLYKDLGWTETARWLEEPQDDRGRQKPPSARATANPLYDAAACVPTCTNDSRALVVIANLALPDFTTLLAEASSSPLTADIHWLASELSVHGRWILAPETPTKICNGERADHILVAAKEKGLVAEIVYVSGCRERLNLPVPNGSENSRIAGPLHRVVAAALLFVFTDEQNLIKTGSLADPAHTKRLQAEGDISSFYLISEAPGRPTLIKRSSLPALPQSPRKSHEVRGHLRRVRGEAYHVRAHRRNG